MMCDGFILGPSDLVEDHELRDSAVGPDLAA